MTAAFLRGEVRQLGSYFCLPIGEKLPGQAEAYTAAMALWPLVAPLAGSDGEVGSTVAKNVIIACNSASVRKTSAVELIGRFCEDVATRGHAYRLSATVKQNITELAAKIRDKPGYLSRHIHEIVSTTAAVAVDGIEEKLKTGDRCFVRADSTEGTANALSYPTRMEALLRERYGEVETRHVRHVVEVKGTKYTVTHTVCRFEADGKKKTVVIEGRGNDPWVPAIEGNRVDELGDALVEDSLEASRQAIRQARHQFRDDDDLDDLFGEIENRPPDFSMMCCTHYPAIKASLQKQYDGMENGVTGFIDQAAIVRELARAIDPDASALEKGPLDLSMTVGSTNRGGVHEAIDSSVGDGNATASSLYNVLDMTLGADKTNDDQARAINSVRVFAQKNAGTDHEAPSIGSRDTVGSLQDQFEYIHRFMGDPIRERILAEQGLSGEFEVDGDGHTVLKSVKAIEGTALRQPSERIRDLADGVPATVAGRIDALSRLATRGENRGIDKIAALSDTGRQLRASVAHIKEVIDANEAATARGEDPQRVAILTGFSVVDNATGDRVGGENDGPPGAVVMARTLVRRGVPVVLVTDRSGEASLASALVGAGLATVISDTPADERRLGEDIRIKDEYRRLIAWEIPHFTNIEPSTKDDRQSNSGLAVRDSVDRLARMNVKTVISIERPSLTEVGDNLYSMVAKDISPFNLDMGPLVLPDEFRGWNPVTIGIGDGGNEIGTGGIADVTMRGRGPDLRPFVQGGNHIAARRALATDAMILSSVSNNGGIALSMALDTALDNWDGDADRDALEDKLDGSIETYNAIIGHMHGEGMSLDGVNKQNRLTVDGRRIGSPEQAAARRETYAARNEEVPLGVGPTGVEGADGDTTHNDLFLKFKTELL